MRSLSLSSQKQIFPLLLILAVFLNNLLWMMLLPYNEGPDELDHYAVCQFIYTNNRLPVFGKDLNYYWMNIATNQPLTSSYLENYEKQNESRLPTGGIFELRPPYIIYPYVCYIFSAVLMKIVGIFSANPLSFLWTARLVSVVSGTLTAFFTWKLAELIFPGRNYLAVLSAIFVGFLPQFTFTSSYVNSDAFSAFCAALLLFAWFRCLRSWRWQNVILLGCSLGLILLSRPNGYILIPLTILFLALFLREGRRSARILAVVLLCAFMTSGWFFIRNYLLHGTLWIPAISGHYLQELVLRTPKFIMEHNNYFAATVVKKDLSLWLLYFGVTFQSFWGFFGWLAITMPRGFYLIAFLLSVTGIKGIIKIITERNLFYDFRIKITFILALIGLPAIVALCIRFSYLPIQGRYFFPILTPLAISFSLGWLAILGKRMGERTACLAISALLIGMNFLSLWLCLIKTYY